MANYSLLSLWHSETEWDNTVYMHDLIVRLMPLYREILLYIGPIVSAENRPIDGNCAATRLTIVVHSSATTRPIFVSLSA